MDQVHGLSVHGVTRFIKWIPSKMRSTATIKMTKGYGWVLISALSPFAARLVARTEHHAPWPPVVRELKLEPRSEKRHKDSSYMI
jgi:hypothetical protein